MSFLRGVSSESEPWSVSELTGYIRELFAIDFRLQDVEVEGEISNFTQARSGHLYFTLKDANSQLKCVMWRSGAERLRLLPQDGDAVIVHGRISIYEAGGIYQLYADTLQPAGRGDLALAFERLKQQLADEGLFAETHKKPIPQFPRKIGIVTSADAAALRDILNVLARRWPLVEVLIAPTLVQGNDAPPQIVRALQWLDGRDDIDTLIIARGGGSLEDLWAFNDERVVRAVFAAQHPVISGVGHEVDFTITDFVADLRAPTPSAAAELATPDIAEIRPLVTALQNELVVVMTDELAAKRSEVQTLLRHLGHLSPRSRLDSHRQRLDMLHGRFLQTMTRKLEREQNRLALLQAQLAAVGPLATLARGYAIVRDENGRIVRRADQVTGGDELTVQVQDGQFAVTVQQS
ncbi:MAG: exodeoxyribonuclease VII large subunit [Ardenticatenaceae bacterium]|nr:exodeoxyribonuclease VII large subunit [Ardenticatenaceae bacterium]MCB8989253.1 exodeoxyribonuclease VII large subunit [Ardenticatenaceae bacterium]